MKTIEIKLYSFNELSDEAKKRVIENRSEDATVEFTSNECMDSLKAIAKACDVRLTDWNIGPYNRSNFVRIDSDLTGHRALHCFVSALYSHGYKRTTHFKDIEFPGVCGFTGVCFDEDVAEEIIAALLDGESLNKAFDRAGDRIMKILEDDLEYQQSEEGILEGLDTSEEVYTEDGDRY